MKRIFTLVLLVGSIVYAGAQIQVTPENNVITADPSEFEVVAHGIVKNMTASTKKYRWERTEECITAPWQSLICDNNLCYAPTTSASPKTFTLAGFQEGILDVHVRPNEVSGGAKIKVRIYEDGNESVEAFMYVTFNSCELSSSKDINVADLKLFPNPTVSQFQLSKADGIRKIEVYNVVGSRLKSFVAAEGEKYDVADLNAGIYMVRLIGANSKVVKTIRLNIR